MTLSLWLAACTPDEPPDTDTPTTTDTGLERVPDGPVWIGESYSYAGSDLVVGDLDADGLPELLVDTVIPDETGTAWNGRVGVLTSPFVGGLLDDEAVARMDTRTLAASGYYTDYRSYYAGDRTGDGQGELLVGPYLYSGLPRGEVDLEEAEVEGPFILSQPCHLDGVAGFCGDAGFWSPDGTRLTFDPPLSGVARDADDGFDLWTTRRDEADGLWISRIQIRPGGPEPLDPTSLPAEEWGPFAVDRPWDSGLYATAADLPGVDLLLIDHGTMEEPVTTVWFGFDPTSTGLPAGSLTFENEEEDPLPIAFGDFDGDGELDVAVGQYVSGYGYVPKVLVFRGPLIGALTEADADRILVGDPPSSSFANALAAGDLDGDGRDDLVIAAAAAEENGGRIVIAWGAML